MKPIFGIDDDDDGGDIVKSSKSLTPHCEVYSIDVGCLVLH